MGGASWQSGTASLPANARRNERVTIPVDGVVTSATFSPDGSSLVMSMHPGDHHTNLFTMQVDGSHRIQITTTPDDEEFGDWAR